MDDLFSRTFTGYGCLKDALDAQQAATQLRLRTEPSIHGCWEAGNDIDPVFPRGKKIELNHADWVDCDIDGEYLALRPSRDSIITIVFVQ
jgi:hypothetical protein